MLELFLYFILVGTLRRGISRRGLHLFSHPFLFHYVIHRTKLSVLCLYICSSEKDTNMFKLTITIDIMYIATVQNCIFHCASYFLKDICYINIKSNVWFQDIYFFPVGNKYKDMYTNKFSSTKWTHLNQNKTSYFLKLVTENIKYLELSNLVF